MYCKYCGKSIDDDSKHCKFCGKSIYNKEINNKEKSEIIHEDVLGQIQCPNCGSYEIEVPGLGCLWWLGLFLGFLIIPAIILMRLDNELKWKDFAEGKKAARCRICGYYFYVDQITSLQIKPNKNLLNSGHKKLEEEKKKWD